MRTLRRELAGLWRCVTDRSKWELALAVPLSWWTLAWVLAQAPTSRPSPLGVVAAPLVWAGVPTGWLDAAGEWFTAPDRRSVLVVVALLAGLLWAATTERAQCPALAGWLAVLGAAEGLGHPAAVYLALSALVGFVVLLTLLALPGKATFPMNRVVLIPRDVLRAGVTAAVLAAMTPLLAPGMVLTRLLRPYVTRPPRPAAGGPAGSRPRDAGNGGGPGTTKDNVTTSPDPRIG